MKRTIRYLLLLYFVTLLSGCKAGKSSVSEDQAIGNQIVVALEQYKADQGLYPDTLSQLVPTYIRQITPPRYGDKRWDYIHYCKNDSFGLMMWGRKQTDDGYVYSSERKKWEVTENSF